MCVYLFAPSRGQPLCTFYSIFVKMTMATTVIFDFFF